MVASNFEGAVSINDGWSMMQLEDVSRVKCCPFNTHIRRHSTRLWGPMSTVLGHHIDAVVSQRTLRPKTFPVMRLVLL